VTISTTRFIRKPLYVDAVQITKQNFVALANWCQGEIRVNEGDELVDYDHSNGINPEAHHIRIRVHNPKNIRQTKGFVGDWILYTDRGYKVYTQKAFKASFDKVYNQKTDEASCDSTEE
jgi:hypothetical protein